MWCAVFQSGGSGDERQKTQSVYPVVPSTGHEIGQEETLGQTHRHSFPLTGDEDRQNRGTRTATVTEHRSWIVI